MIMVLYKLPGLARFAYQHFAKFYLIATIVIVMLLGFPYCYAETVELEKPISEMFTVFAYDDETGAEWWVTPEVKNFVTQAKGKTKALTITQGQMFAKFLQFNKLKEMFGMEFYKASINPDFSLDEQQLEDVMRKLLMKKEGKVVFIEEAEYVDATDKYEGKNIALQLMHFLKLKRFFEHIYTDYNCLEDFKVSLLFTCVVSAHQAYCFPIGGVIKTSKGQDCNEEEEEQIPLELFVTFMWRDNRNELLYNPLFDISFGGQGELKFFPCEINTDTCGPETLATKKPDYRLIRHICFNVSRTSPDGSLLLSIGDVSLYDIGQPADLFFVPNPQLYVLQDREKEKEEFNMLVFTEKPTRFIRWLDDLPLEDKIFWGAITEKGRNFIYKTPAWVGFFHGWFGCLLVENFNTIDGKAMYRPSNTVFYGWIINEPGLDYIVDKQTKTAKLKTASGLVTVYEAETEESVKQFLFSLS